MREKQRMMQKIREKWRPKMTERKSKRKRQMPKQSHHSELPHPKLLTTRILLETSWLRRQVEPWGLEKKTSTRSGTRWMSRNKRKKRARMERRVAKRLTRPRNTNQRSQTHSDTIKYNHFEFCLIWAILLSIISSTPSSNLIKLVFIIPTSTLYFSVSCRIS